MRVDRYSLVPYSDCCVFLLLVLPNWFSFLIENCFPNISLFMNSLVHWMICAECFCFGLQITQVYGFYDECLRK